MPTLIEKKRKSKSVAYEIRLYMDGKRKSISIGQRQDVKMVFEMVSEIERCKKLGAKVPTYVSLWLDSLDEELRLKIADTGLIKSSVVKSATLQDLFDRWYDYPVDRKPNTVINNETAWKRVIEYFDPETELDSITEEEALRFKKFLAVRKYAPATITGIYRKINGWVNLGKKLGICSHNPFSGVKLPPMVNERRMFYVKAEWYPRLIDACPNQNWRTFIALTRIGGLRVDSETSILAWDDIDFEKGLLTVRSPKTERYHGKEKRIIPLFPELREELQKQDKVSELVLPNRFGRANAKDQMIRIIGRAGLPIWEKTFQNLRSSRENDLLEAFPEHVVSAWMGHSVQTERKHYAYAREEDYVKGMSFTK